jgi:molecular chaperone DnaK
MGPVRQCLKDAGVEAKNIDEVVLVGGMTRMPKIQDLVKAYFGKEPHKGVNPDEVVAIGAAVQAGILSGDVKDVLLLDVTPLSLGVETLGGVSTRLIERNTTIPAKKTEVFSTASDNQTSVEIHVLQGEREMAKDNRTLGKFHLVGIPSAPRGVPQVEVTFDIDANGILNVSAKDTATGKTQNITITASSGLAKEEVEKMVKDAESHADEDKKRRELVELKNQADTQAHGLEKLLKENREKVSDDEAKAIDDAVAAVRKAAEAEDAAALKTAHERVTSLSHKLAETLYRKTTPPAGAEAPGGTEAKAGADDVVDAEYTVKN